MFQYLKISKYSVVGSMFLICKKALCVSDTKDPFNLSSFKPCAYKFTVISVIRWKKLLFNLY